MAVFRFIAVNVIIIVAFGSPVHFNLESEGLKIVDPKLPGNSLNCPSLLGPYFHSSHSLP
jgi:hypothetical protein